MKTFGRGAQWIGMLPAQGGGCAPRLRRTFTVNGALVSATLRISGLGYYEAWINGQRVGDQVLDPAQTDYTCRVLYAVHDVTPLLRSGSNALGVMLGNGWYNQDRIWGEQGLAYGDPRLLAALRLVLADGRTQVVGSDAWWTCAPGPITENNIYAGERYDATLEQPGWNGPDFDDSSWAPVVMMAAPGGRLERQDMPPMRRIEMVRPVAMRTGTAGRCVLDMGQNFSGWARIRVKARAGTEIRLRFAEALAPDGTIDTASTGVLHTRVEQADAYICKGKGVETWEPRFTYHGFRYVEVTGWPGTPAPGEIVGVVVHTDLPVAGHFQCSDARLNRLHAMALWTHRSNIHGIPEDCPARERCGWLGDANMVAEFSLWNFHGRAFWEKYLDDIETTRSLNDGLPCNIAPGKRTGGTANPDWAATFILLPWYVYVFHGNRGVLRKHWDGMRRLMDHFCERAENGILEGGYGDWFDPGGDSICTHTPPTLTTTIWFHRCAQVMSAVASLLREPESVRRYTELVSQIRAAFESRFFNRTTGSFGSQTADAMALHMGLAPRGEEGRVLLNLVEDIRRRDTHLNTGIMGVRVLFEVLTRHGHGELARALMHQDTYPGFGDLIQRGATTLWECWGEPRHDAVHGARSLNHPMMGGFDNWFYNTLAGIRPDPAHPGFARFALEPHPIAGLTFVHARHDSPRGRIVSNWRFSRGRFAWTVVVPDDSRAIATLPFSRRRHALGPGTHRLTDAPVVAMQGTQ